MKSFFCLNMQRTCILRNWNIAVPSSMFFVVGWNEKSSNRECNAWNSVNMFVSWSHKWRFKRLFFINALAFLKAQKSADGSFCRAFPKVDQSIAEFVRRWRDEPDTLQLFRNTVQLEAAIVFTADGPVNYVSMTFQIRNPTICSTHISKGNRYPDIHGLAALCEKYSTSLCHRSVGKST